MQATIQTSVTNGIAKQVKHKLKVAHSFKSHLYRDQTRIKKEYNVGVGCVRQALFSNEKIRGTTKFATLVAFNRNVKKKPAPVTTGNSY